MKELIILGEDQSLGNRKKTISSINRSKLENAYTIFGTTKASNWPKIVWTERSFN